MLKPFYTLNVTSSQDNLFKKIKKLDHQIQQPHWPEKKKNPQTYTQPYAAKH
jgi:hypothetical protein